jgi:hypothetical protein
MRTIIALVVLACAVSMFGEDKAAKETSSMTYGPLPNTDARYIQVVRLVVTGTNQKRTFAVTWKEQADAKGYIIERSEGDKPFSRYGETAAGVTKFQEPNLKEGTFTYRVFPIR